MNKNNSSVVVEVVGGLGNQLFCYAAGAYLAKKSNSRLVLDISKIGVGAINHGKTILNFELDCEFIESSKVASNRFLFLQRVSNKAAATSNLYRKFRDRVEGRYTARSLGYETEFASLTQPRKISGYFQSYLYTDLVKDELRRTLTLKAPSDWFKEQVKLMKEENPIVIHMRRGDYLAAKEDFGVLSVSYYEAAVTVLAPHQPNRNIWIFTDSPELILEEIAGSALETARVVIAPTESSPNESLVLMSRASDLVISNSTYSWWAAYLASDNSNVVAPEKWFRQRQDPELLLPDRWAKIKPCWSELEVEYIV